ncbi:MAG TPA: helix-turn-helix transcriptional regulator [Polyangiaceae bacterium]|nr:helix-turn-helix transcriptional regulator [Polyangiaceae bacterium]
MGSRIRRLRKEADFTFDAFVEETGLGRGYISELERGLVVPTLTTLDKVAAALEMTIADLVLGDTTRERLFDRLRGATDAELARVAQALLPLGKTRPATNAVLRVSEPKRRPRRWDDE